MSESGYDIGVLLIRLALGLMLVAHGSNKLFGRGGIAGTAGWFEALGFRPGVRYAWMAAVTEIGAGVLMAVGLLFPAAGAAFVGLMIVAAFTDHRGKGFFVFKGGWEYVGVVGVVAAALVFSGPGRWSLDAVWESPLIGAGWGVAAAVLGAGAACLMLLASQRPQPAA